MHTLIKRIERNSGGDVLGSHFTYGYAVVFPHDNYDGPEPSGADPSIIITRREMPAMDVAIEAAMSRWPARDHKLSQHQWNRFIAALLPEFKLYRPIAALAESLNEKIQEMTEEQLDVFRGLYDDNRRVYVTGVAGSGKTQLALDRAISLASSKQRTLFVCYNKHLADHLDALVQSSPVRTAVNDHLKIRHFHGLAAELVQDAGMQWNASSESAARDRFFLKDVPDMMEQAAYLLLDENKPVQFDAIVMDEAQDFHHRWWDVLQNTLLKESEKGTFYAFGDPVQRLWEWAPHRPPIDLPLRFRLRKNCRNSRWIARTRTELASTEAEFFKHSPIGGKPHIDVVVSMAAMKGIVIAAVTTLIQKGELSPSQIVLIGPRAKDHGSLASISEIAGVALTKSLDQWQAGNGILVTTARGFKGLETDVVIVYDLDALSAAFTVFDLYVACTRGKAHVHFLVRGTELVQVIREAIANVQNQLE